MFFPTLFNVRINWAIYFMGLLGLLIIIPGISFWRFLAFAIAGHQFMLLFYGFGHLNPVRYLVGAMACLQYLVGAAFAYGGLDEQMFVKYKMQVPEDIYFSYAIPAVILFIIGLHFAQKPSGEQIDRKRIARYLAENPRVPYVLIGAGFISSVVSGFFPASLANLFYILGGFKFIGLFMLVIGEKNIKIIPLLIVVGSIIISSLRTAMFHDLVTWTFFVMAMLAIRYKPSVVVKVAFGFFLVIGLVVIQQIKSVYRSAITYGQGDLEQFQESVETVNQGGGFFDLSTVSQSNVRINQGFIVTYAMSNIPEKEPFSDGEELKEILTAAFLPRIMAPNKLKAGDNEFLFKYSGIRLSKGTSMSLSALGDGYVNFGVVGGCLFMFVWGLTFNFLLNRFQRYSRRFPVALLFVPLIIYYPMRPDTALQTGLGHMVKSFFLIWAVLQLWKESFQLKKIKRPKIAETLQWGR